MSERSGMLMLELPSPQLPDPVASVEMRFTTQVLVAALLAFGIGRGGPKRQPVLPGYSGLTTPADEQVQLGCGPPTSVSVVAASVSAPVGVSQLAIRSSEVDWSGIAAGSGTPTPAPPK